jgi:hypothetical protein
MSVRLDWDAVAAETAAILTCPHCSSEAQDGMPQPPWVGARYEPDGIVLVAQNPSSVRDLSKHECHLLQALAKQPSAELLYEWSQHRIGHMTAKPWRQWKEGFQRAVGPCLAPERTAWLNVVPYTTAANRAPSRRDRERCRLDHLAPLLELLQPHGVIARYEAARRAVAATPGPWQAHPMALPGMGVSRLDAWTVHQILHDHLYVPRHPSCAVAA